MIPRKGSGANILTPICLLPVGGSIAAKDGSLHEIELLLPEAQGEVMLFLGWAFWEL